MSNYNWCHNPDCHTIETQSRVRGSGNNKVLRTVKIALRSEYIRESIYAYFCNQNCLFSFLRQFKNEVANIRPVKQPSETPIQVVKIKEQSYRMRYNGNGNDYEKVPYTSTRTTIEKTS
tara:strand:+ start:134 stop:490 length:357 start_codon:yes stop_codon:yes gene_type:complete